MTETTTIGLTRVAIADAVGAAFDTGSADRATLAAVAESRGADSELIAALSGLPDTTFRRLRELWEHLPEIPIGE